MSQFNRNQFQLSFLAVTLLSLTACSAAPKITEITSNAWENTKDVLNIGPQDSQMMDEVDLALMDDHDIAADGVQVAAAQGTTLLPKTEMKGDLRATTENGKLAFGELPEGQAAGQDVVVVAAGADQEHTTGAVLPATAVANGGTGSVQLLDLTHEVSSDETLWEIAKATTGDANNWHILADINKLAPNASVYPGQKLTIPADMVKPNYNADDKAIEQPGIANATESTLEQPAALNPANAEVAVNAETTAESVVPKKEIAAVALNIPEASASDSESTMVIVAETQSKPMVVSGDSNGMADAVVLKVGDGETLWDFAKRTTGDATNWRTLADKNMFGEAQIAKIRPGQEIYVPASLLRARDANGALIAKGEEGKATDATIGGVAPKNNQSIAASAAVLAGTNKPATQATPKEGDIKIVEAAFQENKPVKPVTAESLAEEASQAVAENNEQGNKVMIKGTYYPKAVYHHADFSSSLLMRVSPGTQLLVSKAIGPWLEVKTDKGVGYVHSRDIK